jgi:hypothetical protein
MNKKIDSIYNDFNTMITTAKAEFKEVKQSILTKHGYQDGFSFIPNMTEDEKHKRDFCKRELYTAEQKLYNKYPFYTDFTEVLAGADLFYNFIKSKL